MRAAVTLVLTLLCAAPVFPLSPPAQAAAPAGASASKARVTIAGYVRDQARRPLRGVTVRVRNSRAKARTSRSGRFKLRVRRGRRTITVHHTGYVRAARTVRIRRARRRLHFSLRRVGPPRSARPSAGSNSAAVSNSADRVIFWLRCDEVASLSDADLDRWKARGVDGFVCMGHHLVGGTQDFTSDPRAGLDGPRYSLQRRLTSSNVVRRAAARGMKAYLGFFAVNARNGSTPLVEWFDDPGWRDRVLPAARNLTGAARLLGFSGVAVDQELYGEAGRTATWEWTYPGATRPETEVRAKVRERGRQLMQAMLGQFPGLEMIAYDTQLPESWRAFVQSGGRADVNAIGDDVRIDLWDGLSSVPGYNAIRLMDSTFYKTPRFSGAGWDAALQFNTNRLYSLFSRRFSNWAYASSRVHVSPFSWIDRGPDSDEGARPPSEVAAQLAAFRRWGTGGEFANFAFAGLRGFDYAPYLAAIKTASASGAVDTQPPTLSITTSTTARSQLALAGDTADNLALRAVRWRDGRGGAGVAKLTWVTESGDHRGGWRWRMRWVTDGIRLAPGTTRITVEAEDIKGLVTRRVLSVHR